MNRRGHRGRVDGNHTALVAALRKCGWRVLSLAPLGDGASDVLAYRRDRGLRLVEFKVGGAKLTEAEAAFIQEGWPVSVLRSLDEVVDL